MKPRMKFAELAYQDGCLTEGVLDAIARWEEEMEADLADANARAMELTARCDRERALRVAAERERDLARERAHAGMPLCVCAKWGGCHVNAGMAVVHFFDLARIDTLRRIQDRERSIAGKQSARLSNTLAAQSRWHRRAQAAESRAIKAEREAAVRRDSDGYVVYGPLTEHPRDDVPPSSGGARGLDAADTFDDLRFGEDLDDLARRRVTEPPPVDVDALRRTAREIIQAKTAAIAERDARIEVLERERDGLKGIVDGYGCELLCGTDYNGKPYAVRGNSGAISYVQDAIARAERAEARIAKVAKWASDLRQSSSTQVAMLGQILDEILDGREGA